MRYDATREYIMSGHSRWSTIKRKKALADAKKAKGWTKLLKEIMVSARTSGDINGNPRLRAAVDKAKAGNVPNDTIDRAIKKGTGELEADQTEDLIYQIYAPGGVAIVVELTTDNRNRTASELRKIIEKGNGKIDPSGSVLHKFKKRGQLVFDPALYAEDRITEMALEVGAEDVQVEEGAILVLCEPSAFHEIHEQFLLSKLTPVDAEVTMIPELTVAMSEEEAASIQKLVDALEEHDDVLDVYTNLEISAA